MVGGLNMFGKDAVGELKEVGIPDHGKLRIKMTLYLVASWDNETFRMSVNEVDVLS